jgi:hypothetical protein
VKKARGKGEGKEVKESGGKQTEGRYYGLTQNKIEEFFAKYYRNISKSRERRTIRGCGTCCSRASR